MVHESEPQEGQELGETLGQFLQRERSARGVSLREISETTKIGVASLEALEADDLDALPPRAFVVGFVKAYAGYLKIDPERALELYQQVSSRPEALPDERASGEGGLEDDRALKRIVLFVFAGILAVSLFYAVFVRDWSPKIERHPTTTNAQSSGSKGG